MSTSDFITVLRNADSPRRHAAKTARFRDGAWSIETYARGSLWVAEEHSVTSLDHLYAVLDDLRGRPDCMVVRGKSLRLGVPAPRRLYPRPEQPPTFEPAAHRWLMLDFDSVPLDEWFADNPSGSIARFKAKLPYPFRDAACIWHASSSAGIKPGIRAHLWFWLDRPMSDAELNKWFATGYVGEYKLDTSLFRPVQPHFTADPFIVGAPDPMTQRYEKIVGENPTPTATAEILRLAPGPRQTKQAERELKAECKLLAGTEEGERAKRCFVAALRLGQASILPDALIINSLLDAARLAKMDADEALGHIKNGLKRGRDGRACAAPWRSNLSLGSEGEILCSHKNFREIISLHPTLEGAFAWQERTQHVQVVRDLPWRKAGPFKDTDIFQLQCWFEEELGMRLSSSELTMTLVLHAAHNNPQDPFKDWLTEQVWDGVPRLDGIHKLFNVVDTPYARSTFKWWMLSAVARTIVPGCKADYMLILQGPQGFGKSTALAALLPYPTDMASLGGAASDLCSKDNLMKIHGPVVVCIDEMAAFRARDAETVKHFITERYDRFRPPYGRTTLDFPRSCVFVGTTNQKVFLTDPTGARRFWPHEVTAPINWGKIEALRDQLWAEALATYKKPESRWWPTLEDNELLNIPGHQAARREESPLEERISDFLNSVQTGQQWRGVEGELDGEGKLIRVSSRRLAQGIACTDTDYQRFGGQISACMRMLGWEKKRRKIGGEQVSGWERTQ